MVRFTQFGVVVYVSPRHVAKVAAASEGTILYATITAKDTGFSNGMLVDQPLDEVVALLEGRELDG